MQDFTLYTINELIALLAAVIIGSGAYMTFVARKKKEEINLLFIISVFLMNALMTWMVVELLRLNDWGKFRGIGSLFSSFFGQYFFDYVEKRYLKIGDSVLKKTTRIEIEEDNEIINENYHDDGGEEDNN